MKKDNVVELNSPEAMLDPLTEMLRAGAQQLIEQAVAAELQELLAEHAHRCTAEGNAGVVRNGHLPTRELQTGIGPVSVKIPKVRAKTGEPVTFRSALVPPVCEEDAVTGSGIAMAIPERDIQRRDGRGIEGTGRS